MHCRLPKFVEEKDLVDFNEGEKMLRLYPSALTAWERMRTKALQSAIQMYIISAFRSISRQEEIITAKRAKGIPDEEIFKVSAPPGYSEHHTGRAIDIGTPGSPPLEEAFENTDAFQWLLANASKFGLRLSYPRDNDYGIAYEPWHWFFVG